MSENGRNCSLQRERHGLRSELAWAGFGPLQGGLWIAPGRVEVRAIVSGLGLDAHVRVFRAEADDLTDVRQLIGDAGTPRSCAGGRAGPSTYPTR